MAQWYVVRDGKKYGPFDDDRLKDLAKSGKLNSEDLVCQDDSSKVRKAGEVKGLFTSASPSPPSILESPVVPPNTGRSHETGAARMSLLDRAKDSAANLTELAKKHSRMKALDFFELPAIFNEIGAITLENGIGQDVFRHTYDQIQKIDEQVSELRSTNAPHATATVSDRVKMAGVTAAKSAKAEAFLGRRKKLVTALGESVYAVPEFHSHDALAEAIARAGGLVSQKNQVCKELKSIGERKTLLGNTRRLAIVVLVLLSTVAVAWIGKELVSPYRNSSVAQQSGTASQVLADLNSHLAEARQKRAKIKQQLKDNQLTTAKREELGKAERQLRLEQARLESQRERQIAKDKMAEERAKRAKESILQEEQEQTDRLAFADRLFGGISLDPSKRIALSDSLKRGGATLELRGKDYTSLKRLHEARDWLGLINLLAKVDGRHYHELPTSGVIESVFKRGFYHNQLFVLLRTNQEYGGRGSSLQAVSFPFNEDRTFLYYSGLISRSFTRHPDGIGYLAEWSPADSYTVYFVSKGHEDDQYIYRLEQNLGEFRDNLEAKLNLGEIDEETLKLRMVAEVSRLYEEVLSWALKR